MSERVRVHQALVVCEIEQVYVCGWACRVMGAAYEGFRVEGDLQA